ncbi:MAG: hypothetical protein RRA94_11640, partial [Bacteroidota bacterium]|nr:hypothetical protein [Bacteroidota bacterium]
MFLLSASLLAQVTPQYYLGGGTGSNSFPLNSSSTRKTEHHYLPGEFSGAYGGNITHVYLQRSSTSSSASTFTDLTINLAQTTSSSFPSNTTFWTPVTQVYYASTVVVPSGSANDWFVFPLTTPFPYDPSKSLIVQICQAGYSTGISLRNTSTSTPPYRRIYGASSCAATSGSSNDGYRYSFGFDLVSPLPNNAGIVALTAPVAFCAGSYDVKVKLKNFGNNTLSSASINWSFGGTAQPAINWTGGLAPYAETEVTLGNRSFGAGIPYALVATTSMPNGVPDTDPSNDQLSTTLQAAMSGTYTIGGVSPDFSTFSAAVADLVAFGVCGAVTFNVAAGTYSEQITIPEIGGASATNTITFDGGTGNAASRTLQYSAPQYEAVVTLSGADYLRFRNLTINSTNSSYGYGFLFTGQADYNEITDCVMTFPSNSTSYYHQGVTATSTSSYSSYGNHGNYNLIKDNEIRSPGYYGIRWNGSSSSSTTESVGNQFIGNTITDFYYYGLYLYYSSGIRVIDNTVIQRSSGTYTTSSGYAIYVYYPNDGPIVANNYAEAHYNPMRVYRINNATSSTANRGMVYNNSLVGIGTSTMYGLYVSYAAYADIVYNSANLFNGSSSCYGIYEYGQSSTSYDVRVANNYIAYEGNGTFYPIYNYYFESQTLFDYNAFWHVGTGSEQWRWDGTYYTSLSALKSAVPGQHQNSVEGNPYFVAQNDLHCRSTVGYLAGTPWPTVPTDFDGEPRHALTPCIGADEYPEPPAEYDMAVRKVLVDYATDKWARLEDPAKHKVRVLLENVGLLSDPTTINIGISDAPMNDIGDAQLVENFTPSWDANHHAVVEFSYEVTGLVPMPNATLYARAFLPNEQKPLNDQASDSHEIFGSKVHGYENFAGFEDNANFTYADGYLDMPWTVVNVNGGDRPEISGEAIVMNGATNPADEWIFTPGASLMEAASYRIGFTFTNSASTPVTIELSYGDAPNASSMTTFATFSNVGMGTFTAKQLWLASGQAGDPYFNTPPGGAGMYYLGIHVVTAGTGYSWSMDNIKLDDNPSPPPKIGYAVPGAPIASFIDTDTQPIVVSVTYKSPGLVNKTFQVANTKNIYGLSGDFLWDVETAESWIKITKQTPDPTLQGFNFTPPRPRQF